MKIKKVLVIRFRRVGDAVLTTALCTSLKKTFPDAEIHYVLNSNIAPLYDGHPDVDKVISFSAQDNANIFRYVYRVWTVMRANHYDAIVDVRSTFRTLFFAVLGLTSSYRIGTKKSYSHLLHNYRIDNRKDKSSSVISHLLMLLKPLEQERPIKYCSEFHLYISADEKSEWRFKMEQAGIDFSKPVILAAVTARLAHKVWAKEKMQKILRRMIEQYNAQIIFNFAGDEKTAALALHRDMGNHPNIFTAITANSLRELCALTSNCHFFFGNEGGPRHLSQALGIPSYAIFPPGIPKAMWLPLEGDKYQGVSPDDFLPPAQQLGMSYAERFDLITVDNTWPVLNAMLKKYVADTVQSTTVITH